ncbi:MAG: hypothetical protein IJD40_04325 [Lachnospiraceae bacterium]|nr:hypothetical protein [Lachnospiraceae bacterium]
MDTPLGAIVLKVNHKIINYNTTELKNTTLQFSVDKRYRLSSKVLFNRGDLLECLILPKNRIVFEKCIETGENLSLISFYWQDIKLSIGTQGDLDDRVYEYSENGIKICFKDSASDIRFYIAWKEMKNKEKEDIYTWFAADSAFDEN